MFSAAELLTALLQQCVTGSGVGGGGGGTPLAFHSLVCGSGSLDSQKPGDFNSDFFLSFSFPFFLPLLSSTARCLLQVQVCEKVTGAVTPSQSHWLVTTHMRFSLLVRPAKGRDASIHLLQMLIFLPLAAPPEGKTLTRAASSSLDSSTIMKSSCAMHASKSPSTVRRRRLFLVLVVRLSRVWLQLSRHETARVLTTAATPGSLHRHHVTSKGSGGTFNTPLPCLGTYTVFQANRG